MLLLVAPRAALSKQLTSDGMCLDWSFETDKDVGPGHHEAYMMPCDGQPNQQWHATSWGGLTTDNKHCLDWTHNTYGSSLHHVYTSDCDSGSGDQKWTLASQKLTSGGLCFEWTSSTHDRGRHAAYLDACSDAPHQKVTPSDGPGGLTIVFPHGMAGSKCYRIPAILHTSNGTLVAFSEARLDGCSDSGTHNLVSRRSTDGGQSWGELIVVTRGEHRPKHTLSNPNPVEVNLGNGKMAIYMAFDTENNPKKSNHGDTMQIWSYDDGKTWADSSVIHGLTQEGFSGCMPGPSLGIQEKDGVIYFVCHTLYHAFLAWSKDLGHSWQHSETVDGIDECSIASLPDDNIAMNCKSKCGRSQLTWSPAGLLLSNHCIKGLPDPGCEGSMVYWQSALYLSNDASTSGRNHLTVRRSVDEGQSWDHGVLVEAGYSGYSQLVGLPGNATMGVLYENSAGIAFKKVETTTEIDIVV